MTASTVARFHVRDPAALPAQWRSPDSFSVVRLRSDCGLINRLEKVASGRSVLVSVCLRPLARHHYALWVGDTVVPTESILPFRSNVIDMDAKPSCWAGSAFEWMHYTVPRQVLDDVASDLGTGTIGDVRLAAAEDDLVIAQFTKSILSDVGRTAWPSELLLDHLQLILGAHLVQRYAAVRRAPRLPRRGLSAREMHRALEILNENLAGRISLTSLARECGLSPSHFARSFKATLGVSPHQWLARRRIELAKELLAATGESLAAIADRTGFVDQPAFTRAFHRSVGASPGRWRRDNRLVH